MLFKRQNTNITNESGYRQILFIGCKTMKRSGRIQKRIDFIDCNKNDDNPKYIDFEKLFSLFLPCLKKKSRQSTACYQWHERQARLMSNRIFATNTQ